MSFPTTLGPEEQDTTMRTTQKIHIMLWDLLNGTGSFPNGLPVDLTPAGGGVQRTVAIATVSTSGSVAAGARSVEFLFSSDFAGTVDGETFAGATDYSLGPLVAPQGDTLGAIAYTRSAGSIRIVTIT